MNVIEESSTGNDTSVNDSSTDINDNPTSDNSTEEKDENNTDTCQKVDKPEGLLITLYREESSVWEKVVNLDAYDIIAVVNPDNGPGDTVSPLYQEVVSDLVANVKTPIGYIHTDYGNRSIDEIKAEIDKWIELYPEIKGFFLDTVSDNKTHFDFYKEIYDYIKSKGNYIVVLNIGTYPDESYFEIADNIVIYEGEPNDFDSSLCNNYPEKSSLIIYNADENTMTDLMQNSSCSYKYITDDTLPNPYDTLPSYIDREAELSKYDNICIN